MPSPAPRPSPTRAAPPKTVGLAMRTGDVFDPSSLTINRGGTVTVTNKDLQAHNWTDSGVFMSGDLPPQGKASYTFHVAGTFSYECTIHSGMGGVITVR